MKGTAPTAPCIHCKMAFYQGIICAAQLPQIMAKCNPRKRVRLCTENWGLSDKQQFAPTAPTRVPVHTKQGFNSEERATLDISATRGWNGYGLGHSECPASRNLYSPLNTVSGAKFTEPQDITAPTEYRLFQR